MFITGRAIHIDILVFKNSHSGITGGGKQCLKRLVILSHTSKEYSFLCIWTDITCGKF